MQDTEEGRILARAQRGDMVAFESLVRMHQQRVFMHCYRMVSNSAEAEDLCSETFLRAFQHLKSLRADPSIVHWLLRVANNLAITALRKRGSRPTIELDMVREVASDDPSPEEKMVDKSRKDIVRHCLERLSPKERIAVVMFYLEERPLDEIARVLNCGLAGAKSRVHRGRHRLKALVTAELGEDVMLSLKEESELC